MPPAKSMKTTIASGEAAFDLTGMRKVHASFPRPSPSPHAGLLRFLQCV